MFSTKHLLRSRYVSLAALLIGIPLLLRSFPGAAPHDHHKPLFPRSNFEIPKSQPSLALANHPPVEISIVEGYWGGDTTVDMWGRNFTCRSGLQCVTRWDQDYSHLDVDVILTLDPTPSFLPLVNRNKTKMAFLGMEPYHFDVDMEHDFDIKASVYQSEATIQPWRPKPGPPDDRHVWTTYSEIPWESYFGQRALLDWSKKSKSRAVMFVSSNSCPEHRSNFVHQLVKGGLDVWSFGTCASEHEKTDRVAALKKLCGDEAGWGDVDWRAPKNCITEHFKFIISIENSLNDDYVSEKFFHPFGVSTVPIYWGPKNIDIYAPGPKSFISMRDYGDTPDPAKIIELVNYYNNNDTAYEEFFDWKRKKQFQPGFAEVNYRSWNNIGCMLCEKSVEMDQRSIPWGNQRI